jgi:hypothetical protein
MAGVEGYGPFSLYVIHYEGPCPTSKDINRLMMMPIRGPISLLIACSFNLLLLFKVYGSHYQYTAQSFAKYCKVDKQRQILSNNGEAKYYFEQVYLLCHFKRQNN